MEIYACLSSRRTHSETAIYERKHRNLCVGKISNLEENRGDLHLATYLRTDILSNILGESSSDDSEENFRDFLKIFTRKRITKRRNVVVRKDLEQISERFRNYSSRFCKEGDCINSMSESEESEIIGLSDVGKNRRKMHYRPNSAYSKNGSMYSYSPDFCKRYRVASREAKHHTYTNGVIHCFDNQSKYRANRYRSLSPNLPKIPYLEKPPQYTSPIPTTPQRKARVLFKNKVCKENEKLNKDVSKKSILDHALMKSLLSGLSIFDNEDEVRGSNSKNFHKHKSMGNIKSSTTGNCTLRGSTRSNVDFRDSAVGNCGEMCENFKDYYASYKQGYNKCHLPNDKDECCQFNNNCCYMDSGDRFVDESQRSFPKERGEIQYRCEVSPIDLPPRRNTLVERRKNFFENRKKQIEFENIKMRPTALVISCVERQIQNDFDKSDEITELYRNLRSVQSTSTLSKRSSSLPPINRFRRCGARNSDLFNPDYNFCYENNNSNNMIFKNSIIESIRSKIFQTNGGSKPDCNENWRSEPAYIPKFPKETRRAMSIILSNKNSSISCKLCREKFRTKQLSHIETQTSPQISQHEIVPESSGDASKLPCCKNLLCDKGYHTGRCEESVRRKLDVVCDEHCDCRDNRVVPEYSDESIWPGQAVRLCKDDHLHPQEFLGAIYPDLDTSEGNTSCQQIETPYTQTPSTMNGLNGHTNGDLNGCGDIITQNQQRGCWTIGLINSKYKYLTAETFGFKINANGASLKKKQIWTLEPDTSSGNDTCVYLKSHLDKYLAVDSFGNVTCENEEKEPGSKFQVTVAEDNTGRWAFRNVVRGYFLGSSADKLTCTAKAPGDSEYWHIHLAARPQVNLRSVGRKRFAHLSENLDEIHVDANIPWGEDTLFTLEFHADEDGKYALHTCNNKYLSNGGKLVDTCNKDCLFSAEYHSGQLALRDRSGQYLSPIGSKAVLKTRSNTVTKDELFSLEDSLPQASFVAALNSRYVSVKQGVDVTANQDEISAHEMFQLEFDWSTKRWYIRTMQDKYWTLETGGGIQASGDKRSSNALFDLVWQGDGSLAFRANNGRYVMTKRSGHLYATSDVIDDNCKYYFYLINRPILVLKCEQGFVGYKSSSSPKLECNKATYECIQVERSEKGIIHFKGQNGKFWHVDSEGVTSDSDTPEGFYLELREPTRLCIKAVNGNYLTASKNGLFRLGDSAFENATQWEY